MSLENAVRDAIRPVMDPELMVSVLELGLIYAIEVNPADKTARIRMTLTSPMCPAGPQIIAAIKHAAEKVPDIAEAQVQLVWEPPWDPATMATDDAKDVLGIW